MVFSHFPNGWLILASPTFPLRNSSPRCSQKHVPKHYITPSHYATHRNVVRFAELLPAFQSARRFASPPSPVATSGGENVQFVYRNHVVIHAICDSWVTNDLSDSTNGWFWMTNGSWLMIANSDGSWLMDDSSLLNGSTMHVGKKNVIGTIPQSSPYR